MTTKQAIQLLHRLQDEQFDGIHGDERREALDMAVRALKQNLVKESGGLVKDCISRQQAIDALDKHIDTFDAIDTNYLCGLRTAMSILKEMPSAQPETHDKRTETHACDLIGRQEAIAIERNATVDTNPSHFEAHQKFTQFMDDAEVSSFGRWQWSNGFNTALTAVGIDLKNLPSAQPERKKGKWVDNKNIAFPQCSICGMWIDVLQQSGKMNYCPNCGADMRTEGNDDN